MSKKELLYEQGIDLTLVSKLPSVEILFNQMASILKGDTTVKTLTKDFKLSTGIVGKEFDILYYGKFPEWLHEYVIEEWCRFIGSKLDKSVLKIIVELGISEWESYFCSETSLELLYRGCENIYNHYTHHIKWDNHMRKLQATVDFLETRNHVINHLLSLKEKPSK